MSTTVLLQWHSRLARRTYMSVSTKKCEGREFEPPLEQVVLPTPKFDYITYMHRWSFRWSFFLNAFLRAHRELYQLLLSAQMRGLLIVQFHSYKQQLLLYRYPEMTPLSSQGWHCQPKPNISSSSFFWFCGSVSRYERSQFPWLA